MEDSHPRTAEPQPDAAVRGAEKGELPPTRHFGQFLATSLVGLGDEDGIEVEGRVAEPERDTGLSDFAS